MIIKRKETWGIIQYDTSKYRFSYIQNNGKEAIPYINKPVLLNCDLTLKCNMDCIHCVAMDLKREVDEDLTISKETIDWINNSPFMVIVITGGEPFLNEYQERLIILLQEIKGKGLIIDTNGTITPSKSLCDAIRKTRALVRISWDSARPQDEIYLRRKNSNAKVDDDINLEYYYKKIAMIGWFRKHDINIAVQSVVHRRNLTSIIDMPAKLHELSIRQWYLQRFIPSYIVAEDEKLRVGTSEYDKITAKLIKRCHREKIECITKRDKRYNSVFLLVGDRLLYTQGEKPRQKILLGDTRSEIEYFRYVSPADHSERYYRQGQKL